MQGIRVVKAFALEPFMRARQGAAIDSFERAANKLSTVGARSSPLTESLGGVGDRDGHRLWRPQGDRVGSAARSFFAFITALILAFEPAKRVARTQIDLMQSLLGVEMLYKFLDEPATESRARRRAGDHGRAPAASNFARSIFPIGRASRCCARSISSPSPA